MKPIGLFRVRYPPKAVSKVTTISFTVSALREGSSAVQECPVREGNW